MGFLQKCLLARKRSYLTEKGLFSRKAPDGRQRFAGATQACSVIREDIAGFPGNGDQAAGTYHEGKIWYARLLTADQMVPVRMQFETEFGRLEGYLAELRGTGVYLQFMD
jgi:hypothetical protein